MYLMVGRSFKEHSLCGLFEGRALFCITCKSANWTLVEIEMPNLESSAWSFTKKRKNESKEHKTADYKLLKATHNVID